jgi:hypothetical protein
MDTPVPLSVATNPVPGWRRALRKIGGSSGRLLILAYDSVVGSGDFAWQMEQLAARFKPIPMSRLLGHVGSKKPLAGSQVCVVWCAASRSERLDALAVLRRLQLAATYGPQVDSLQALARSGSADALLDWDDLRDIAGAGGDIAPHLHSASRLVALPCEQRRSELAWLRQATQREVGIKVAAFVYSGNAGQAPAPSLLHDAALAGFSLGVSAAGGVNSLRPFAPLMLSRQCVAVDMARPRYLAIIDEFARGGSCRASLSLHSPNAHRQS